MSNEITVRGTVHDILETQSFPSGFCKRILVIKTDDKYPQTIPVEFVKEKCDMLDQLCVGQGATAYVNLRGNEYNGKYYASIQGWKFEAGNKPEMTPAHSSNQQRTAAGGVATTDKGWEDDPDSQIPF